MVFVSIPPRVSTTRLPSKSSRRYLHDAKDLKVSVKRPTWKRRPLLSCFEKRSVSSIPTYNFIYVEMMMMNPNKIVVVLLDVGHGKYETSNHYPTNRCRRIHHPINNLVISNSSRYETLLNPLTKRRLFPNFPQSKTFN